jgi:hypothetical protein
VAGEHHAEQVVDLAHPMADFHTRSTLGTTALSRGVRVFSTT